MDPHVTQRISLKRPLTSRIGRPSVRTEVALERHEFVKRLREARSAKGWTQTDAAREIGVSIRAYTRWESTGEDWAIPHSTRMDHICAVLGVSRDYLQGPPPEQVSETTDLLRILDAKLDVLLSLAGFDLAGLPAAPSELITALEERQSAAKPSRRRKPA